VQAGEKVVALPVQGYRYELGTLEQLRVLERVAHQLTLRHDPA
jgi:hypothetical protein